MTLLGQAAQPSPLLGPVVAICTNAFGQVSTAGGHYVACDTVNRRFLTVWNYWNQTNNDIDIYGQLVNADNSLHQQMIPIRVLEGSQGYFQLAFPSPLTFDANHQRFMVVWQDNRTNGWQVYSQIVSTDGNLIGSNSRVSPTNQPFYGSWYYSPTIQYDSVNDRYLVVYIADAGGGGGPYNVFCQLVDSGGSLPGTPIQITWHTNDANYYAFRQNVAYDPANQRFLVTCDNGYDGYTYGRFIAADGSLIGSETAVAHYGDWVNPGVWGSIGLTFDPATGRFLHVWGQNRGQLINSDGSLFGTNFIVFNRYFQPTVYGGGIALTVDTVNHRFIATVNADGFGGGGPIVGQLLNLDGSWDGAAFYVCSPGQVWFQHSAFAANGTSGLVVWSDRGYPGQPPPGFYGEKFSVFPIPHVSSVTCSNRLVAMSLDNLAPYATHWIERSTNLAASSGWQQIAGPISSVESTNWSETMTNSFGQAFYRIKSAVPQ